MEKPERIRIEIAYAADARTQTLIALDVPLGTSAAAAISLMSGDAFAGVDPASAALGIFGRRIAPEQLLREGDRLEIYRELIADPKDARRDRVRRQRKASGTATSKT
jgi:putative ubiquitin-RnfH superfamily antitoxin RatB of RatAB toxin-antitoxin module